VPRAPVSLAPEIPFLGFSGKARRFLRDLGRKQDRDWFSARKSDYEALWQQPMGALLDEVRGRLGKVYPSLAQSKVFRVQRDVRFSADKRPYKTHCAGILHVAGPARHPTQAPAAVYVQLGGEDGDFAGAGEYAFQGVALQSFREALLDAEAGAEIRKIVAGLEKKGFGLASAGELKKVPPGVDMDHPNARLLRMKGLIASFPAIPAKTTESPAFAGWLADRAREAAPLVTWLVRHIEHKEPDGRRR
jgi:uncharacterized protein (TIGR02453 family)